MSNTLWILLSSLNMVDTQWTVVNESDETFWNIRRSSGDPNQVPGLQEKSHETEAFQILS